MKETTYSAFTAEKRGLSHLTSEAKTFGRQRTYYRVTQTGKDYYREKCLEWQETKEVVSKFIKEAK